MTRKVRMERMRKRDIKFQKDAKTDKKVNCISGLEFVYALKLSIGKKKSAEMSAKK